MNKIPINSLKKRHTHLIIQSLFDETFKRYQTDQLHLFVELSHIFPELSQWLEEGLITVPLFADMSEQLNKTKRL
mgnify:FL=1